MMTQEHTSEYAKKRSSILKKLIADSRSLIAKIKKDR